MNAKELAEKILEYIPLDPGLFNDQKVEVKGKIESLLSSALEEAIWKEQYNEGRRIKKYKADAYEECAKIAEEHETFSLPERIRLAAKIRAKARELK